jgi:hypothetical protein
MLSSGFGAGETTGLDRLHRVDSVESADLIDAEVRYANVASTGF